MFESVGTRQDGRICSSNLAVNGFVDLPKRTESGILLTLICGRSSVVERLLAKEKVVSSNLIARSARAGQQAGSFAEVAQLVEHSTENAGVPSSSLGLGTSELVNCE